MLLVEILNIFDLMLDLSKIGSNIGSSNKTNFKNNAVSILFTSSCKQIGTTI